MNEAPAPAPPVAVTRWRVKRAAEVEAAHWDGVVNTAAAIIGWILAGGGTARYHDGPGAMVIGTADGDQAAVAGDWVARYPAGTFRPFTGAELTALYEPAAGDTTPVPAGELAAFGLLMDRALAGVREQVAREIEAEAAARLYFIRRAMHWAAWTARGKPPESDPASDRELSGALLHGDAERTGVPCCPVETAAIAAERERIREAAGGLKFTVWRGGTGQEQPLDVVPLAGLLRLLEGA